GRRNGCLGWSRCPSRGAATIRPPPGSRIAAAGASEPSTTQRGGSAMWSWRTKQASRASRPRPSFKPPLETLQGRITPAFAIRATELNNLGAVVASSTQTSPAGPGSALNAFFSLPDFAITIVGNNSATGTGFSAHSTTINMLYTGPTGA